MSGICYFDGLYSGFSHKVGKRVCPDLGYIEGQQRVVTSVRYDGMISIPVNLDTIGL